MAAAVGADAAWFSTCGSSLSVKAAMMAVLEATAVCWSGVTATSRSSPVYLLGRAAALDHAAMGRRHGTFRIRRRPRTSVPRGTTPTPQGRSGLPQPVRHLRRPGRDRARYATTGENR